MSRLATVSVFLFLSMTNLASAKAAVSETSVRQAIATFLRMPASPSSKRSMSTIVTFASESDDVSVTVSQKAVPWYGDKEVQHGEVLLCAFISGNILSQLDTGVNRDDSYSGLVKVFRVYRYLQKRRKGYSVPAVDRLLQVHKDGKLMKHLSSGE